MIRNLFLIIPLILLVIVSSCQQGQQGFKGAKGEVKIMTLDPGHFHAALIQKTSYKQVSSKVHVFAPQGSDVEDHLNRIKGFNTRAENPTSWTEITYAGPDFLDKMIAERPGNVVVISGNNRQKTQYIKACADAGLNLLVDKPMCIDKKGFDLLLEAFDSAQANNVLLYDVMTERSEITAILQKELMHCPEVFGELKTGSPEEPAVESESVHHFFKYVAGNPIKRPGWYMDTNQEGEGIVDVTTHLLDLVAWQCFPEVTLDYQKDIEVTAARRWPTMVTKAQYQKVTHLDDFIPELKVKLNDEGLLPCYANGEIDYKIKGVHAQVRVQWKYQAPEGAKDTHYGIARGTKADIVIRQGKEQNYRPEIYVEPATRTQGRSLNQALPQAVAELEKKYPGIKAEKIAEGWHIFVPDEYRIGHEAHFRQVTERYLQYLVDQKLPAWEIPNMKAKYFITTTALEMARAAE
jgi:predicted dehydrogenase